MNILIPATRPRRRWLTNATAAVLAVIIWQGLVRRPTPEAQGTSLHAVAGGGIGDRLSPLRVASFNIAGGVSPEDNRLDLGRTAKYFQSMDVVGMQEVHGPWLMEHRDQAQILGELLHLPWLFAPSETQWWQPSFGNAALCRLPVTHWQRWPLAMSLQSSNRTLLSLTATWQARSLTVLITHLDRHVDHRAELGAVLAAFADAPSPAILMGDLNLVEPDARLTALRNDPAVIDAIGQNAGAFLNPLNYDWIFAKGLRCTAGGLKENDASDHPMAWAEFQSP